MIELSVLEILDIAPVLKELSAQEFNGKTAFNIARIIRETTNEIQSFDTARQKLISEYCERNEEGNPVLDEGQNYRIAEANINIFNNSIQDILQSKVNLNINYLALDDLINIQCTPQQMLALQPIIKE